MLFLALGKVMLLNIGFIPGMVNSRSVMVSCGVM